MPVYDVSSYDALKRVPLKDLIHKAVVQQALLAEVWEMFQETLPFTASHLGDMYPYRADLPARIQQALEE